MLFDNKDISPVWIRSLFAISVLALLFGAGLQIEGLWRLRQERIELQRWPSVTASVISCFLEPDYPFQKDGGGVIYTVVCRFRYSVNDVGYESMVKIVGSHHSSRHPAQLPEDALQMQVWAERHKKGSLQVIHYNPQDPGSISLAGADDEISQHASGVALTAAKQAFVVGLGFFLSAVLARTMFTKKKRISAP